MADRKPSPELQQFLAQEQAKAQLQQTVAKVTETCWDKCMTSIDRDLSSRQRSCLDYCARRYLDTAQVILKHLELKAQRVSGSPYE